MTGDELQQQYKDSHNLEARGRLHALYSTNKYGWLRWVFDQFDLPPNAAILELGCGNGWLWATNQSRVPPSWKLTLSDFSAGMLDAARQNLAGFEPKPSFEVINAQSIDLKASQFDAVVANHMLYHVADLDAAMKGICRVLKAGGVLYATTNGRDHMGELREIVRQLAPDLPFSLRVNADAFGLESSMATLGSYFSNVERRLYDDCLEVTDAEPLVAWAMSIRGAQTMLDEAKLAMLREVIEKRIASAGAMHITKSAGMFIARKA